MASTTADPIPDRHGSARRRRPLFIPTPACLTFNDNNGSDDGIGWRAAANNDDFGLDSAPEPEPEPEFELEVEFEPDVDMAPVGGQLAAAANMAGTQGHRVRPFVGVPEHWPVYEAYAMNVAEEMLDRRRMGGRTWNQFSVSGTSAKKLLFLLIKAVEAALSTASGQPEHAVSVGDVARARQKRAAEMDQWLIDHGGRGKVRRMPGVYGQDNMAAVAAVLSDTMLADKIIAPTADPSLFMYTTHPRDAPHPTNVTVARRISVFLEELATEQGAETVGWRWWFFVHDPRIHLTQWIDWAIKENRQAETQLRQRIAQAERRGGGRNKAAVDLAQFDAIGDPEACHRAIRGVHDFAEAVRMYFSSCADTAADRLLASTRLDQAALTHGVGAVQSDIHPARVFSPQVAMDLYTGRVCTGQKALDVYCYAITGRLGKSSRPGRTTGYDSSPRKMNGPALGKLVFPDTCRREQVRVLLQYEHLVRNADDLPMPDSVRAALKDGNFATSMRLFGDRDVWTESNLSQTALVPSLQAAIHENVIESRETGSPAADFSIGQVGAPDSEPDGEPDGEPDQQPSSGAAVSMGLFSQMLSAEDTTSSLTLTHVERSPVLQERARNVALVMQIRARYPRETDMYCNAMEQYRLAAVRQFKSVVEESLTDPTLLSKPMREGFGWLLEVGKARNPIRRQASAFRRVVAEDPRQLMAATLGAVYRGAGQAESAPVLPLSLDSETGKEFWFEWPVGALNLTDYGNWRVSIHYREVKSFRVRPGAAPLLHRLLIGQGAAWRYYWGLGPNNLIWGPGGGGKSFLFHCVRQQSFPGQVEFMDHLTKNAFTTDEDMNDSLILIEEAPPDYVSQDERGNLTGGNEILKTLTTRHDVNTGQCFIRDDGKRVRMTATNRVMSLIYETTNLHVKTKQRDGNKPPLLRRFVMDHVGWGRSLVPLSAIVMPLSREMELAKQPRFAKQMQVINVLCMLVEKLIEAYVLEDVNTDVCGFHFNRFFDEVHRRCRVPRADSSICEQLIAMCRQTCIRYAVHRVFFSETAASEVRYRLKPGARIGSTNPNDWECNEFDWAMVLRVQPFLVVTEEMMVDVLTTMRSVYIPTITWSVLNSLQDQCATREPQYRLVAKSRLDRQRRKNPPAGSEPPQKRQRVLPPESEFDQAMADTRRRRRRLRLFGQPQDEVAMDGDDEDEEEADSDAFSLNPHRIVKDSNYHAFVFPGLTQACDHFSAANMGRLEPTVFQQVLIELSHLHVKHRDRCSPKLAADGRSYEHDQDGVPVYEKTLRQPVVLIEPVPESPVTGYRKRRADTGTGQQIQVCILAEFLEEKRQDSVNEILRDLLSYQDARPRDLITGVAIEDVYEVNGSNVVLEYLDVISVSPVQGVRPTFVNHFVDTAMTDSFVDNEDPPQAAAAAALRRQYSLVLDRDLNEIAFETYWTRAGVRHDPALFPWKYTQRLIAMVKSGRDGTGAALSNRFHSHYPASFRDARFVAAQQRLDTGAAPPDIPGWNEELGVVRFPIQVENGALASFSQYLQSS